jgi:DNA-binding MarR family transcriptional regulator
LALLDSATREQVLSKTRPPIKLTRSICEEALENFSQSDDSLADLIEDNHIEVRDFMVLSFICDQDEMTIDQLTRTLGLGRSTVVGCVERLQTAGLARYHLVAETADSSDRVIPTPAGRTITDRILSET